MWALALLMEMGPHKDREKLWMGIEPTTFGLDLRRSADYTGSDGSRPWEKVFAFEKIPPH